MNLEINGYRYAILEETGDRFINVTLNRRLLRFIIYTILCEVLVGIYLTIAIGLVADSNSLLANNGLSILLAFFLFLLGFYLMFRFSLLYILVSIDHSQPFKTSWRLIKGNVLRVIGLSILVGLTVLFIGVLVGLVMAFIWIILSTLIGIFSALGMFLIWLVLDALIGMANAPLEITEGIILWSQLVIGVVLALLWIIFLVLLSWAVNSKMMGLIYQRLSGQNVN